MLVRVCISPDVMFHNWGTGSMSALLFQVNLDSAPSGGGEVCNSKLEISLPMGSQLASAIVYVCNLNFEVSRYDSVRV